MPHYLLRFEVALLLVHLLKLELTYVQLLFFKEVEDTAGHVVVDKADGNVLNEIDHLALLDVYFVRVRIEQAPILEYLRSILQVLEVHLRKSQRKLLLLVTIKIKCFKYELRKQAGYLVFLLQDRLQVLLYRLNVFNEILREHLGGFEFVSAGVELQHLQLHPQPLNLTLRLARPLLTLTQIGLHLLSVAIIFDGLHFLEQLLVDIVPVPLSILKSYLLISQNFQLRSQPHILLLNNIQILQTPIFLRPHFLYLSGQIRHLGLERVDAVVPLAVARQGRGAASLEESV